MSEEFYNSSTNQDEDFDYSPINSPNSASESPNDSANGINDGGETATTSASHPAFKIHFCKTVFLNKTYQKNCKIETRLKITGINDATPLARNSGRHH